MTIFLIGSFSFDLGWSLKGGERVSKRYGNGPLGEVVAGPETSRLD